MSSARPEADTPANPFCTRCVRPGARAFLFSGAQTAAELAARFQSARRRGVVVGPHGSGKSTLLATLVPELKRRGHRIAAIALHDGQRRLPSRFPPPSAGADTVLVIDGYEQLGRTARCRLWWLCRRRQLGLLVTAHRRVRLPVLFCTEVDLRLAQRLARDLQRGFPRLVDDDDVAREFPRCEGNLRELLFQLFDLYEARQRKGE